MVKVNKSDKRGNKSEDWRIKSEGQEEKYGKTGIEK